MPVPWLMESRLEVTHLWRPFWSCAFSAHKHSVKNRLRCMDCGESHHPGGGKGCVKYGKQWKCSKCNSAMRWLRENDPDWQQRTQQEKKDLILANRDHGGRGSARQMHTVHKACQLSLTARAGRSKWTSLTRTRLAPPTSTNLGCELRHRWSVCFVT